MYHRFHAPHDCRVTGVTYFSGDCWNVNPPTLKRVERARAVFAKEGLPLGDVRVGAADPVEAFAKPIV